MINISELRSMVNATQFESFANSVINTMKTIAGTINKRVAVGARLRLAKWCKQHGYEVVPVLHDAIDMLDLELEAK